MLDSAPLTQKLLPRNSAISLRLKIERPGHPGVVVEGMHRGRACDMGRVGLFPTDASHVCCWGRFRLSRRDETFGRCAVTAHSVSFEGALKMV